MVNYWLAKQEPSGPRGYNILQLKEDKKTIWDGVHNNLALKHIRNMKKGDLVFFYHTGDERQVVGIMSVTSNPYPNPEEDNERFVVVDVKFKSLLAKSVGLDEIKKQKGLESWELLRISRLSVMPVPKSILQSILKTGFKIDSKTKTPKDNVTTFANGRHSDIFVGEKAVGIIGEISSDVLDNFKIRTSVVGFEIKLSGLIFD